MEPALPAPRSADPEMSLQVDTMILEYLFYNATKGLLAERRAAKQGSTLDGADRPDLPLQMVDAFLPMYRHNHHPDTIDDKVKFRLRLLKFATLFTRRFVENEATPSPEALQELRQTIRTRAREWLVEQDTPEFDQEYLEFNAEAEELHRNKGLFVHRLALPPDFVDFYGSDRSVTLLDLLPSFLATASSMRRVFSTNMSQMFMELAATFMMQASMEQYLVYGSKGVGPLMECFAWGWRRSPSEVWQDEADVIQMFKDEDLQEEVDGWAEVRSKYFNLLQPASGVSLTEHLETVARENSIGRFEDQMLDFLGALLESVDRPDLDQLERGQFTGVSPEEAEEILRHVRSQGVN